MLTTRARRRTTISASIRSWRSQDGRYSVEEVNSLLDDYRYYLVTQRLPNGNQVIVSRHRKRTAAVKSCETVCSRS